MAKAGAVTRYRTPLRSALRDGFTDKEGFINGIYAQPRVFLYNTRMIARDKAPQSFEDLLDPRWKDKLGMDTTDYDWLASLIDYYGRGKALEFAEKLSKQQLNLRRGPTLLAQLGCGRVSGGRGRFSRRDHTDEECQGAGGFHFHRALRGGENADHGVSRFRRAASARGGAVRGFSPFQSWAGSDGEPGTLGDPKGWQLLHRSQGQEDADSLARLGRETGRVDQAL